MLQANPTPLSDNINQFLGDTGVAITQTKPHAFVNWVLFDNQFNYVAASSGFDQMGGDQEFKKHILTNLPVSESGYLYIYTNNETPNIDVFFDNLQVTHTRGPLLEEDHYYPFGLTMAGISDKALKGQYAENKYRYNGGNELQNKEFSDGSGLELYDAVHRMYDPQLGRFGQIDPLAEISHTFSPYNFAVDNPILRNDPLGLKDTVVNGENVHRDKDLQAVTVTAAKPGSLTNGLNNYNYGQVDAWVGFMMGHGHSASQINKWALSNDLLNQDTRRWILNGTTTASGNYRHSMAESWKAQGKLYKFFLISALTGGAGEAIAGLSAVGDEAVVLEDVAEDGAEDVMEETTSVYHKGELNGGEVSSTRPLSTGTNRSAVEALNRSGKVWEFKIPSNKMF